MSAQTIQAEIETWQEANPAKDYWNVDDFQNFWTAVEQGEDITLPSGRVEYVTQEQNGDESLAVFSVGGTNYALKGYDNSWASAWEEVREVVQETVTLTRWTTI